MEQSVLKLDLLNSFGTNFVQKSTDRYVRRSLHFLETFDQPLIIYPIGRHIGIRNVVTNKMHYIRQPDYVQETTGLNLSGNRRYLAVQEDRANDLHVYASFYDMKVITNPKLIKTVNISELMYGSLRFKAGDEHPPVQKHIVSFSFSKCNKYIAVVCSDKN